MSTEIRRLLQAAGDLKAYGDEEVANALKAKDREQYQFWQGWNSALDRILATPPWQEAPLTRIHAFTDTDGTRIELVDDLPSGLPPVDAQGHEQDDNEDAKALTRNGKTESHPANPATALKDGVTRK